MAKKKPTKPAVEEEEELDDIEDELLDEDDLSSDYPKKSDTPEKDETSTLAGDDDSVQGEEEEEPFEIEEEPRYPDYRHLKLSLIKTLGDNDYELSVKGQSHGFCNILVKHLLSIEGVKAAAYKITGIVPPQIFIRLEENSELEIKDILVKAIESLRAEVVDVQKVFQKLM
ncbi:MAG: RpoL/Rpb11 RNA polymerase subunit family protein [Promethearchaeota archaeon]|jgi:DNA-directed RNA polymerase subunit L